MKASLVNCNAVVLANVFNPSIFRLDWLEHEGILQKNELQPGYLFSADGVSIPTPRFNLTVLPQQLSFLPATREIAGSLMTDVLGRLIALLPHTPIGAGGLNFVWHVDPEDEVLPSLTRRMFFPSEFCLADDFSGSDAQFGLYMSKDIVGECRLKLDIKPVIEVGEVKRRLIHMAFNFHRDVGGEKAAEDIGSLLSRWSAYEELATRMVDKVTGVG